MDWTVAAVVVVPTECETWSTAVISATVDKPEYSRAMTAMSAAEVGLAVMVSVPPPLAIGAVQMLISAPSAAVK